MLAGKKPMAVFNRYTFETFDETSAQPFSEYVARGTIEKCRFYLRDEQRNMKQIYTIFTTPGEKWRVPIYRNIMKSLQTRWNRDLEIIQGILLGYKLEEMAEHIDKMFSADPLVPPIPSSQT